MPSPPPHPPDVDAINWQLLLRHTAGDATLAEATQVERWLAANPDHRQIQAALVAAFDVDLASPPPPSDSAAVWRGVHERLAASRGSASRRHRDRDAAMSSQRPSVIMGHVGLRGAAIAASTLAALGLGLAVGSIPRGLRSARTGHAYTTGPGQRLSVTLADGTQLTLAPASRVRAAADAREVELEGEAYFAVVHDAAHPFVVRAHGAVAQDVGTAFDVRAYPEDAGARIVVAQGAVAIRAASGRRGVEATAGDVATVADTTIAVEHGVDVASLTAWRQGKLIFARTPLADVVHDLSRAFDLSIRVEDPVLASQRITASFEHESADQVLDDIADIVGGSYERVGHTVVIRRQGRAEWHGASPVTPLTTVQGAVRAREPRQ